MAAAPDPSSDCGGIPRDCDEEARRQHGNLLEMAKQAIAYGHSFLVTGAGGTGKSHFIGDLVRELEANLAHTMACEGSFLVTAMTGVAATVLDEHNGTNSSIDVPQRIRHHQRRRVGCGVGVHPLRDSA